MQHGGEQVHEGDYNHQGIGPPPAPVREKLAGWERTEKQWYLLRSPPSYYAEAEAHSFKCSRHTAFGVHNSKP